MASRTPSPCLEPMLALLSKRLSLEHMSAEADIILSATSLQPVPTGLGPTWNLGFWLVFALAWCELGASLGGALTGGPPGGGGGALVGGALGVVGVCIIDDSEALFGTGDDGSPALGADGAACCAAWALLLCQRSGRFVSDGADVAALWSEGEFTPVELAEACSFGLS